MADSNEPGSRAASLQSSAGRFRNAIAIPRTGLLESLRLFRSVLFDKPRTSVPDRPIPVRPLTRAELLAAPDFSLYRLGHSTVLLKLRGQFWITDPVFAQRASPLPWMGPKRFHAPPIALKDLPPLKGVILSHNHYDHLDKAAVRALAGSAEHFVAPLGVGDTLVRWGVPAAKVQQLDWWQSTVIDGLRLVATPAQHFSGRGLRDGNATLWCSWVLIDDGLRVFFSGDSGYFDGFRQIGERFGPFDLTLVETGAYDRQWPHVHMRPEESLQAHLDLQGRWMLPIHNGTFDLALHPWFEPFERISALAAERGVALSTPVIGERVDLRQPTAGSAWWRLLK
ncbi:MULTISPECIES: MBL fold metallo-hydrolase [Pseudoxanthomonas]|uniref:L-ascorbate metabolism protein UlaG (Beta-lactamase superfamily) n=1 Tax=Pseudoxanthomonas winnipegensis TaxID=2480810 RepID=A0AAW8GE45_9GAMM|nr:MULTISPECIES: MBL fold metallo-hydrolase [Pseudoxanthomonas]MDQ1120455.1 L-ascorbate metabolism protein UlaG (beta-lactamase superfamily) [Pseudoxanthomonas winnipegensis]MDQ1133674.1 L-ascorbate metabolism protein UlaG (beta-lactamase superfamily) [Pseudoxanthomonas winnipegensis]MDR6140086.1 L-ascorbate metabolism protein UlaG (beta-lactamase superfamily) [Pseudoxanthomonas sp. SORGH_AS_0997]